MSSFVRYLLAFCIIRLIIPNAIKAQSVSFQGSFGYDEYGVKYLDRDFMGSNGYDSKLFMTSLGGSFGIQFTTKRGGLIRPRLDFGTTRLSRVGFFRKNEVKAEFAGRDVGTRFHFMLDFGHEEEIIENKLRLSFLFGFGLGIDEGRISQWDLDESYDFEGLGLMMQPVLSLTYQIKPFFRVGLEQRHELSLFQYGQESTSSYDSHGWTVFTVNRFLNYIPPVLRAEFVLNTKKKE